MRHLRPLLEQHLPTVLKDARSKLLKPTGDEQAGAVLLEQLLAAFTERALSAGKVALLKRLSLVVSKAVGAGYSYPVEAYACKPSPNPDPILSPNRALNQTQDCQQRRGHA